MSSRIEELERLFEDLAAKDRVTKEDLYELLSVIRERKRKSLIINRDPDLVRVDLSAEDKWWIFLYWLDAKIHATIMLDRRTGDLDIFVK